MMHFFLSVPQAKSLIDVRNSNLLPLNSTALPWQKEVKDN